MDATKQASMERCRERLARAGTLTPDEIERFIRYEYLQELLTLEEQLDRYYLKLKENKPDRAAEMLKDIEQARQWDNLPTEEQFCNLTEMLAKYYGNSSVLFDKDGKMHTA